MVSQHHFIYFQNKKHLTPKQCTARFLTPQTSALACLGKTLNRENVLENKTNRSRLGRARWSFRRIATLLVMGWLMLVTSASMPRDARAQVVVSDPAQIKFEVIKKAKMIIQLKQQADQLINQGKQLEATLKAFKGADFNTLEKLKFWTHQSRQVYAQSQHIGYSLEQTSRQLEDLYGENKDHPSTAKVYAWRDATHSASRDSIHSQSQALDELEKLGSRANSIEGKSRSASNALQATQATNELLLVVVKQNEQLLQMMGQHMRASDLADLERTSNQSVEEARQTAFFAGGVADHTSFSPVISSGQMSLDKLTTSGRATPKKDHSASQDKADFGIANEMLADNMNYLAERYDKAQGTVMKLIVLLGSIEIALIGLFALFGKDDIVEKIAVKLVQIAMVVFVVGSFGTIAHGVRALFVGQAGGASTAMARPTNPSQIANEGIQKVKFLLDPDYAPELDKDGAAKQRTESQKQEHDLMGAMAHGVLATVAPKTATALGMSEMTGITQNPTRALGEAVSGVIFRFMVIGLALLIVAVHMIAALIVYFINIEFQVITLLVVVLIPFALNRHLSSFATQALNALVRSGVKLATIVVLVNMLGPLIQGVHLTNSPSVVEMLSVLFAALLQMFAFLRGAQIAGQVMSGSGGGIDVGGMSERAAQRVVNQGKRMMGNAAAAATGGASSGASAGMKAGGAAVGAGIGAAAAGGRRGASQGKSGKTTGGATTGQASNLVARANAMSADGSTSPSKGSSVNTSAPRDSSSSSGSSNTTNASSSGASGAGAKGASATPSSRMGGRSNPTQRLGDGPGVMSQTRGGATTSGHRDGAGAKGARGAGAASSSSPASTSGPASTNGSIGQVPSGARDGKTTQSKHTED